MKIATIALPDMHWFLDGIESVFRTQHEVRRCDSGHSTDIDAALSWCDVAWCEFAAEAAIYCANREGPPLIVRMHSYEAYGLVESVPWRRVATLVHTSEHVRDIAIGRAHMLAGVPAVMLPSAVDTARFAKQEHAAGFRIGLAAWVRPEKNLFAALQILRSLRDVEDRYTLDVAGMQDCPRTSVYLQHAARDLDLGPAALRFHGHVEDMAEFWRTKDYCLSASMREGCPYNVLEAMSCGVRPVIHAYRGAEAQFPDAWLWRRMDEAVEQILDTRADYDSAAYRALAEERYSLASQADALLAVVEDARRRG